MTVRMAMMMAVALTLSACGGSDPAPGPQVQAPDTGAAAEVAKLDEAARGGVLERAIRASGAPCPSVTGSERAEVRHGVRGWKAQCSDGNAHLIEILADGTANVTSRRN